MRDVALGCGNEVGIEMEGKETELDKTIIAIVTDLDIDLSTAVERALITAEKAARLIERETCNLYLPSRIFHCGKGDYCGVGMDVVKTNAREAARPRGECKPRFFP